MNKKDTTTLDRKVAKLRMYFLFFAYLYFLCGSRCQRLQEETYFFALGANMTSATEVIKWSREQHGKVEAGNNPMMRILETWSY